MYLGGHPEKEIEVYNAFISFCDATISNSRNVKKMWQSKIDRNNVPLNYIIPKGSEKSMKLKKILPEGINIVFAGRLIKGKGVEILLESFRDILNDFSNSILWILGDGLEKESLRKRAIELGIEEYVRFCGFVDNVQDYFYSSTICVFPSVYKEGLMTVVAEAMAVGACVVTSTNMGNEELITNGENGILIESNNRFLLTETLSSLINNNEKRAVLGNNAENFAIKNLSWSNVGKKLNDILIDIINNLKKDASIINNK